MRDDPAQRAAASASRETPASGRLAVRSVLGAVALLPLLIAAKTLVVAAGLVGPGVVGYLVAGHLGATTGWLVAAGLTIGAALTVVACYAAVVRTSDSAAIVHDVAGDAGVWVAAGWLVAIGWLVGDAVSTTAAVAGVLIAVAVVAALGVVVVSRLDADVVTVLRRRAAGRSRHQHHGS
ncbi:hypothetical protein [Phytoactinopolyspora limicola]|uniref:hypothetical protein n=1 Tax=Phytoactinopolyspora limicola TaxID=2715536 RepID=UPI001409F35F|nr:hypothetical protein [Phytoactinopolyspora limicola]